MFLLFALHVLSIALLLAVRTRLLWIALPAPILTTVWAMTHVVDPDAEPPAEHLDWVPELGLSFSARLSPVAALVTVAVAGIGALILVFAHGYFGRDGLTPRFVATLSTFSLSMLGLVWADSIWTLFVFWEATSITSFLLVGYKHAGESAQLAARRALMVTAAGGLVLLAGLVVLADTTGTTRLSEMSPVSGTSAGVAAVLLIVAAATKSAQVPFHVWLPGAMEAPTPVSAYLHSATMVKVGILLIAVTGPVLGDLAVFEATAVVFGVVSMVWGAVGALRHHDAKLILAWGTISQLGTMLTLFALDEGKATFAAMSILVAHALFKAALFIAVGAIDVRYGTRDIRHLSRVWHEMPITAAAFVVAAASMAGVPPLLGFAAKEAAIEAVLGLDGAGGTAVAWLVIGSAVLTVAYTVRLTVGILGHATGDVVADRAIALPRARATALGGPAGVLSALSVIGFVAIGPPSGWVRDAAAGLDEKAGVYSLLRWPGLTTGLVVSLTVVAVGTGLGFALARRGGAAPAATGAGLVDDSIDAVLHLAKVTTARTQHGSLPVYLATMAVTASVAAIPVFLAIDLGDVRVADTTLQLVVAIGLTGSALAALRVEGRIDAALALGIVGLLVSAVFVAHGSPDLVITQVLVETVVVVGFVLGLGRLRREFPRPTGTWRVLRPVVSVAAAITVGGLLLAAGSTPATGTRPELVAQAVDEGGGNNVVNVILTDIRALDTFGEVVRAGGRVAVGILALARSRSTRSAAA